MKPIMDLFRWPVEACIYLLDREPDLYTIKPERKRAIIEEVGCSEVTMNRAVKAIKVREMLINSAIGVTKLDKKLTDKNFILQCTIDRLKGHVKYMYRMIEEIIETHKIPDFMGDLRIREIYRMLGRESGDGE